ncbi:MAG: valine--tRNA ligase [Planctomycetes bacterium]|nr:valine--tRNA ligase [Planctomycetota bacterium]
MELSTRYTPADFEARIYTDWLASGGFQPGPETKAEKTFTIMIPPPNVTGVLHMGHALNGTVQDIVMRFKRMNGYTALWVPGTDHAGIATQAVVEKQLYEKEKKTRNDLGREAFLKRVWEWKEEHGSYILEQFRRLGSSCDWSRTRFTMEPMLTTAVRESFVRLWEKGLIYRGARLVNWDCVLETAVSDDEIEYVPRKDKLYEIRYPVKGQAGEFVTVATTRPETMLGDTGVAVNPNDERWKHLIGKSLVLPFIGREIPVVGDDQVEMDFGTGAVKITPGHDPADYERGQRFKLPIINLYEKDGRLNDNGGPFAGLSREKARTEVVKKLEELELLGKVEDYSHNVAVSDRSKSVIEPIVSEQWFVKMEPLAQPAIKAVKDGTLKFRPERWTKVYLDWLENVHDWCISRQLWWGHQIPVWYDADDVPVASRTDLAIGSPHPKTKKPIVRQDPDVLDTWASSWLWPFATLGWPDKTPDLARFYPTQFLSTAREIIYLWVARMVMAGYEFMDHLPMEERCPFDVCNIHATVLDGKGRRMSKSAGNGIDPIEMIDKYGADAVRYSLVLLTKEGQDVKLSPDRFEQGYRFSNKVWNAARFVLMNMSGATLVDPTSKAGREQCRLEDRWILSRLARVRSEVSEKLDAYMFNDAAMALYQFVWNDFCDWYVEIVKSRMSDANDPSGPVARGTLARVLNDALALLHPFTPYMTEALWSNLNETLKRKQPLLMNCNWPDGSGLEIDERAESEMQTIQDLVHAVRQIRNLTTAGERQPLQAKIAAPKQAERDVLLAHVATVRALASLETCEIADKVTRPKNSAVAVTGGVEVFVALAENVDLGKLKDVLARRAEKVRQGIGGIDSKLHNAAFVERADPDVVAGEKVRRAELVTELQLLERNLSDV